MMDVVNRVLNLVVPPASLVMLAFAWPTLTFINTCEWLYATYIDPQTMDGKVVVVTGASSGIGEAAKSALINFYETLRFELKDEVGITVATHGWVGTEMTRGKFMVEEGAEMQWKEEREVHVSGGPVEEFAKLIVAGACRGDPYIKYPSWYDIFFMYRVFAPKVLYWTFQFLLKSGGARQTSFIGTGRPLLEGSPTRRLIPSPTTSQAFQVQKIE